MTVLFLNRYPLYINWDLSIRKISMNQDDPIKTFCQLLNGRGLGRNNEYTSRAEEDLRERGKYIILNEYKDKGVTTQIRLIFDGHTSESYNNNWLYAMFRCPGKEGYTTFAIGTSCIIAAYDATNGEYVNIGKYARVYRNIIDEALGSENIMILESKVPNVELHNLNESRQLIITGFYSDSRRILL